MNATFTTLLSKTHTNAYGNTYTTSLIHRTAGLAAAGSTGEVVKEAYLVRSQKAGDNTFHGTMHADKLDALDAYNARVGTFVSLEG